MNNAGIRPLIFESLFVMPPFALGRHHACLLQHAHEVVEEVLLHDLALFVPEALPLKWNDVDLGSEPGCIRVRDSKTAAGVRPVWLTKHCRNTLIQWREFLGPDFSEYVFPSPRIPSTHVSDYKKGWQKAAREAGIPDRRIYDLQASFASRANACHASGLTIAQLLGHSNSTQILPTYVKPLDENTRAVINALDAARTSRPGTSG
jgi:integrase